MYIDRSFFILLEFQLDPLTKYKFESSKSIVCDVKHNHFT